MKCYVCQNKATAIRTGNAVCDFHASEEGFPELEKKALNDTYGEVKEWQQQHSLL